MTGRPTSPPARGAGRGFTVIEVLATLALAGIVLPVATRGILLCLATAAHTESHATAVALAQTKLDELVATGQWYDQEMQGDFGEESPAYTWAAIVADWEDPRLVQLDVAVMWTRRGQDREVVLSTLIYTGSPDE